MNDLNLFEYCVINSNDGGAIRIFFTYYNDKSLFVPKILFKVSDKQAFEEQQKIKKMNIKLLAKNYSPYQEVMTKELIQIIIDRLKSLKERENRSNTISNNEIQENFTEVSQNKM